MHNFFTWSFTGAVFIAVICLLRLLLKGQLPRTAFVALWLAAIFRLLCPLRLPAATSIWRLFTQGPALPGAAAAQPAHTHPQAAAPVDAALQNSASPFSAWYIAIALLLLAVIAALYLRGLHSRRSAQRLDNGAYLCEGIASPCVCGIVRPRILLPDGISEEQLPYILLHEQVHAKRLDNLWKLLALVAAAIHWCNPMVWILVVLLSRDLEVSCDEWALRGLSTEQRRSYALSLITLAERPAGRSPLHCGFTQNPLEERIRCIMTTRKKSAFALGLATAVCLCTTAAFATDAPAVQKSAPSASPAAVSTPLEQYELFTAEEYAAYMAQEKEAMQKELQAGALSQQTYDMTVADMEETLAGLQDGSLLATKPVTGEDGSISVYVISNPDLAAEGYQVENAITEDGMLVVTIGSEE